MADFRICVPFLDSLQDDMKSDDQQRNIKYRKCFLRGADFEVEEFISILPLVCMADHIGKRKIGNTRPTHFLIWNNAGNNGAYISLDTVFAKLGVPQ